MPYRLLKRIALGALIGLCLQSHAEPVRPGSQLLADGIPLFERSPQAVRKEPPAYRFVDWHPLRREMLVLGRASGVTQLQRLSAPGASLQPLTRGSDAVNAAQWEPAHGRYLVFSRDHKGDEAYRLFRLADGEVEAGAPSVALTPAGERVSAFEFLPASQGLVYLLERLDRQAQPGLDGGARQARSRLVWLDPQRPESARQLAEVVGGRFTGLRISPGGAIVLTETRAGKSQQLRFGLDGKPGLPLGAAQKADELDDEDWIWTRAASQGDFRHLQRIDAATGERQPLLAGAAADLEALAVPPRVDGRPLALVSNEAGLSVLRLYDPAKAEQAPQRVAEDLPAGVLRSPRWHQRRAELGFDHVSAQSPGRIYSWSLADGALQAWTPGEEGEAAPALDLLRWKSFDGLEISGLHTSPPARFKGRRPVYIQIHGGPSSQARPGYLSATLRQLVEQQGMHVIQPNVRGSDGFGKSYLNLDNGRKREDAVKDISALLDLIATREDMDASRVIVAGGSYGGYMALAVATQESARIAGAICRVGIANFISFLEQTESYRRDNRRAEYGDEREPEMREFLRRISPLTRAAEVKKPLFVVHGRNDPRVPHAEAQQMVAAVRRSGTPVWFLTAENEGHSFVRSDNRDYLAQATAEFVRRVLAGQTLTNTP